MEAGPTKSLKVVLIGEEAAGKTALLHRLQHDQFTTFYEKCLSPEPIIFARGGVRLSFWDTYGHQRFRKITCTFFRGMHLGIICFDCRSRAQFDGLPSYLEDIKAVCISRDASNIKNRPELLLISTFSDYDGERVVNVAEAERFAVENDLHYLDFSSRTGSQFALQEKLLEAAEKYLMFR